MSKKIDEARALAEQWAARVSAAEPGRTDVPSDYQFRFSKDERFQLHAAFEQIAALLTAAQTEELLVGACSCGLPRDDESDPPVAVFSSGFLSRPGRDPALTRSLGLNPYPPVQLRACRSCLAVYATKWAIER